MIGLEVHGGPEVHVCLAESRTLETWRDGDTEVPGIPWLVKRWDKNESEESLTIGPGVPCLGLVQKQLMVCRMQHLLNASA